jgi:hypothetical protein
MISSILQYSTMDLRFLEVNLTQLSKFSDEIIIPICDHFFNGQPENTELLEKSFEIASKFPKCSIYMFEWEGHQSNTGYYHNLSRAIGTDIAKNDWLLFVDADEIVDDGFEYWFETIKNTNYIYWLTCYWYFREPIYQATKTESAGLLIRKEDCNWNLHVREERQQLFNHKLINGDRISIVSKDNKPFIHHYSWYRTKEEMLKKVENWGHKNDTNWTALVEEEFSRPFNGTDFVHGYQYNIVENKFNL